MKNRLLQVGLLALLFIAGLARANEANFQPYLIGDRAAGMGAGICAIANNVDAMYYNPAGLTRSTRNSLSLSANLYGWQRYEADNAFYPGEEFKSDSFQSIPTTIGVVLRANTNWVVGFATLVPEKWSYFETSVFHHDEHYYTISADNQTLWIGPSAACQLTPQWSLGASTFMVYHGYNSFLGLYWGDREQFYTRSFQITDYEWLGLVGMQYRLTDRWNLGLAVQTPTVNIYSDGEWLENVAEGGNNRFAGDVRHVDSLKAKKVQPALIRLGVGWEHPRVAAWGMDMTYHFPASGSQLSGVTDEGESFDVTLRHRWVFDVNIGGEYYLWKRYPLRAGFFTSQSSAEYLDVTTDSPDVGRLDLYGLTFTAGIETRNTTMNVGVNYAFGSGDDYGWMLDPDGNVIRATADAKESHLYFIFNTSYFF